MPYNKHKTNDCSGEQIYSSAGTHEPLLASVILYAHGLASREICSVVCASVHMSLSRIHI